jgi:beta-glucanase (GH16 family)
MKKVTTSLKVLLMLMMLVNVGAKAQTYNLVWSDEFNGSISNSWRHEIGGGGWGNNEKQYYQSNNTTVSSTELIITAKKESVGGMPYTSSRLVTSGSANPKSFTYGRMEARMRLPMGQGLWPAFWMLGTNISSVGWPSCGEIDIMEHINSDATVFGTIHWQGPNGYANYSGPSAAGTPGNYHAYRVDWNSTDIRWFVDGVQYHIVSILNSVNSTEEFHRPFFFILNLAVAGNWPGQTVDESKLPATMAVDYVRAYQLGSSTFSSTIEAENFVSSAGVITEGCSEGGLNVGSFDAGDWTAYSVNIPATGTYKVTYRVASPYSGKTLRLEKDNGATNLGTVNIPNTGSWQTWTSVSINVSLPAGQYNIGLATSTGGLNINRFNITNNLSARSAEPEVVVEHQNNLTAYPNPMINTVSYKLPEGTRSHNMQIIDISGRPVTDQSFGDVGSENTVDVAHLTSGMYLIKISNHNFNKIMKVKKQ